MTPNEITTVLASGMNKVFDVPFKLMLMERVAVWRARHIRNTLEKNIQDRKFFRSTIFLSCTKTKEVPCTLPVDVCDVFVTGKVPEPIRANGILFDNVGPISGSNPFIETSPGTAFYRTAGKYSKHSVGYIYSDQKIYVLSSIPMIRVDFIAAYPEQVQDYQCTPTDDYTCDFWDTEYPCSADILQLIMQSIREVDFKQDPELKEQSIPVNPLDDISK